MRRTEMEKMKLTSLTLVTNEPAIQSSVLATIEDTLPPLIHAVAGEPMPRRIVRRLNVDEVLERSLPKVSEGFGKAA
jgi:hypothetical protein